MDSNVAVLWLYVQMILTHRFLGIAVLTTFMEMLLSAPIHPTFLLNEHAVFAFVSSFTRNLLLTICSLVDGLFILKALNTGQLLLNFQRHVNTISFFYGLRQQTPSVLHSPRIHVQQFTYAARSLETGRF